MTEQPNETPLSDTARTARRTLTVAGILALLAILWFAHDVFLLLFAGLLFGILLDGITSRHIRYTKLSRAWGLTTTVLTFIFLIVTVVHLLAPGVSEQVWQLEHDLPASIAHLRSYIGQYEWGRDLVDHIPNLGDVLTQTDNLFAKATGVFSASLNVIIHVILVLVVGIYIAAEPRTYRDGFASLFPPAHRAKVDLILTRIHDTLWWWILSILGAMFSISLLTFIGLSILHIPLALTLALLTGLLTFIPNFGPIMSAVLPTLLGLMDSPARALTVLVTYVAIQFVESHFVTPLIQRHTIKLPPALAICAQLTFGVLFGFMGLLLAIPLVATVLVIVQTLYVERLEATVVEVAA